MGRILCINEGEIRIYTWNQTDNTWELVGTITDGPYEHRYAGSLSKNGNIFTIGGEQSSHVDVYQLTQYTSEPT